jgi:hypothetical protein
MTMKPERVLSPQQSEAFERLLASVADAPAPRKAFHAEHPCELNAYHAPTPVMVEYHHQKPVFLQNRLYGKILYGPELWVCGNCHDAIHAWLYWLLGEHKQPPYIGTHAKAEAQRTFDWYISEGGKVG